MDRVVEAGQPRHPRRHAVAAVEADDDVLRAVEPELLDDQLAVPRRGLPGHVAQVVALHVVAQAVELPPLAQPRRGAAAEAAQGEAVEPPMQSPDGLEVRQHLHLTGYRQGEPALDQPPAGDRGVRRRQRRPPALDAAHREAETRQLPRPQPPRLLARRRLEERRPDLPHHQAERPRRVARDPELHLLRLVERERQARRPLGGEPRAAERPGLDRRRRAERQDGGGERRREPRQPVRRDGGDCQERQ